MPGQKSIRGNDAGKASEAFSSNRLALGGQTTALSVIEAWPLAQLLLEDSDLLLKIFDCQLLAVIHPPAKQTSRKRKGVIPGDFAQRHFGASKSSETASRI